jgi:sugar phosphate isomerase/epimerase
VAERFPEFAFSTSWNFRNSKVGRVLMDEIIELGFRKVELNYRIAEDALETIEPMIVRGELAVESVHNVFPENTDPRFDTDSRLLGYEDEDLRRRAVALAVGSAEFAVRLGAKAVVVHPGIAPEGNGRDGEYDERLKALYREKGPGSPEFRALFDEIVAFRKKVGGPESDRVLKSLEEIAEEIRRRGLPVRIGLENRPICTQMPDFAEMRRFLDALDGSAVGFWFDTGHGAMHRHLGFFDDRTEAWALRDRLVGMHIHDVDGVDDHFAPYEREGLDDYLDLIELSPIRVLELGKKNSAEAVVRGALTLQKKLADRKTGADA